MEKLKGLSPELLIALLAALLFLPFLGAVHLFDWDEINFAESAREMLVSGNYAQVQVNFRPFWEKPPLFIWMQAGSMQLFGVNEFAARFPNAICGLISLLVLFRFGKKYYSARMGWLWVLAYLGSFTPHLYFKTGIIDPWFNLFIFLSLMMIAEGSENKGRLRQLSFLLGGIFIGLALLTKGPVSVLVILLCLSIMLVWRRFKFFFSWKDVLLYSFACIAVSFVWYGTEIMRNGFWFIQEFVQYQQELASQSVATHGQPWYYHPLVLLFGAFPASVIALPAVFGASAKEEEQALFRRWMLILFWVVLILFSIVKTKIIHYSSLCYLPLTFLAAYTMEQVLQGKMILRKWQAGFTLGIGLICGIAFFAVPLALMVPEWKSLLLESMQDPFAYANFSLPVSWNWVALLPGTVLILTSIIGGIQLLKARWANGFTLLFLGGLFTIQSFLLTVVPRVEVHTQGAAIQFLEVVGEQDAYVETLGYKSYAQYYYGKSPQIGDTSSYNDYHALNVNRYSSVPKRDIPTLLYRDWLIHGKLDKPAFFISKVQHRNEFEAIESLEVIDQKGGFVFYRRLNAHEWSDQP